VSGLLYEIGTEAAGKWAKLATLTPDDPPGSISQNTPDGRDVIMFYCGGDHSVVERSLGGGDIEVDAMRVVTTAGTERLATLKPGQTYEADVVSDKGIAYKARWTHVA
jgi:hypothetical protein